MTERLRTAVVHSLSELEALSPEVEVVVLSDAPLTDDRVALLARLYSERSEPEVLGRWMPFPEALKKISNDVVEHGVDRRSVGGVGLPLVFRRKSIREATDPLGMVSDLARSGARIAVFDEEDDR